MDIDSGLPLGKLPPDLLAGMLRGAPVLDPRVLLGPGIGLDCAVIDLGERMLVIKSDPITFASDAIGWYAVQVNANDIATTGAEPRWFLGTLLMPEGKASAQMAEEIAGQLFSACRTLGISAVGGHTEVTHGIDHPILAGTLIGEVRRDGLVTPRGARPGDRLLLPKGVPIEATAILAREFPQRLRPHLSEDELTQAAHYLYEPGISVVKDARTACVSGRVTAMHDPTEAGLAGALWELADACWHSLVFDRAAVPVPDLARRVCAIFGLDPLATIASGALLMAVDKADSSKICGALREEGIACSDIGFVKEGPPEVCLAADNSLLERPLRDEITRAYESGG